MLQAEDEPSGRPRNGRSACCWPLRRLTPAQEITQLAASDNRFAIIATLFLPVVGWVLFNIGGPALNQLANTAEK